MYKKSLGKQGEKIVENYLKEKGYQILDRNYQKRFGEIDLIALSPDKKEIVFIEVKTRKSKQYGYPEEAVNQKKLEKIQKTGLMWLEENYETDMHWCIDVISLELSGKEKITHLKNVTL